MTFLSRPLHHTVLLVLLALALALAGCGEDPAIEEPEPANAGWVRIMQPTADPSYAPPAHTTHILVGGDAFVSPEGSGHVRVCTCVGLLGCLLGFGECRWVYTTGVEVTVANMSAQQPVSFRANNSESSTWSHDMTLVPGANRIKARASDNYGNSGTDWITIIAPPVSTGADLDDAVEE